MTFEKTANRFGAVALLLAASLAAVGCGDDDAGPTPLTDMGGGTDMNRTDLGGGDVDLGTSADLGAPLDMPAATDAGAAVDAAFPMGTLTINGTITELTATGEGGVIAGATICVIEPAGGPCVTSAADGTFTATGIPENTEMLIEITKDAFMPALATVTSGTIDVDFSYLIARRTTVATLGFVISETIMPTKGQIFAQIGAAGGGGAAGVTVTLTPTSGAGPFYATAAGVPSRTLTETTTSGTAIFANVDPGDYVVTFSHATLTCTPTGFAWAGTAAETTRLPVQADHITSTIVTCI